MQRFALLCPAKSDTHCKLFGLSPSENFTCHCGDHGLSFVKLPTWEIVELLMFNTISIWLLILGEWKKCLRKEKKNKHAKLCNTPEMSINTNDVVYLSNFYIGINPHTVKKSSHWNHQIHLLLWEHHQDCPIHWSFFSFVTLNKMKFFILTKL